MEGIETEGTVRIPYLLCLHGERKRGVLEHNGRGLLLVLSVYCSSLRPPHAPPTSFFQTDAQLFHTYAIRFLQLGKILDSSLSLHL